MTNGVTDASARAGNPRQSRERAADPLGLPRKQNNRQMNIYPATINTNNHQTRKREKGREALNQLQAVSDQCLGHALSSTDSATSVASSITSSGMGMGMAPSHLSSSLYPLCLSLPHLLLEPKKNNIKKKTGIDKKAIGRKCPDLGLKSDMREAHGCLGSYLRIS
ncbi:hypothetical protein NL676_021640 [Syzygium grande]|nr:hypothetical protein NL676_021640 [Syzygium grande]